MMGNLFAESALSPINLQNTYEKKLGYSDSAYTIAVDNGTYTNFIKDSAGYGLAQWTFWSRKQNLLNYAKSKGVSIGDLNMQLEFLMQELNAGYKPLLNTLKTTNSVSEASNGVLLQFERPADQSSAVQQKRASYGQKYFNQFANTKGEGVMQINIVKKTNTHNTSSRPNRNLKWIVIHYTAGTQSRPGAAANTAQYFATTTVQASADFIVDDATIVQYNPDIRNRNTWHCGGGKQSSYGAKYYQQCTNSNSIGIEVCSSNKTGRVTNANDANWYYTDAVIEQTILLTKYLMETYNIDADHVIRHFDVTGKLCPGIIGWNSVTGDESKWHAFKARLSGAVVIQPTEVNYRGEVTASTLNCRSGSSTSYPVVKTYALGTRVTITKEQNGWGYTGDGWVSLNYIKKVVETPVVKPVVPDIIEEEEEMTQEKFNEMMNAWITEQAAKDPGDWSREAREWAENAGLIASDTNGKKMYKKPMTREEFVTVLHRALHRYFI